MDLRRLSSFLVLVDEGSFTRAARRLGITQPSLSQQIRTLEAEVGGPLVERLAKGIRLTAAGKALLPEARAAVRAAERAGTAARMALGLEAGELEVATLLSFTVGILPQAIMRWHARYPDMRVRMLEYTHRGLLEESVRAGAGDIALGPKPASWDGAAESLGYEELVVILPHSDPLAGRPTLPLAALADRLWILFQPGHGLTDVVVTACRAAGFQPRVGVRTTQVAAAASLAAAGLGPAIVPDNVISPGLDASVVRLDPPLVRELAAYTRSEWSPLAATFLEALREGSWKRHPGPEAVQL
ncbi:MAG TPA: LysR family transcriptional regulator [Gaiellaceae bacterium]|nr:LysR family transcriptional regulator [Gaiellaceae bacterium]